MKKIIAVLLTALMLLSCFAGCGSAGSSTGEENGVAKPLV